MKISIATLAFLIAQSSVASEISIDLGSRPFKQYQSILEGQVAWAEKTFNQNISGVLGCPYVPFKLAIKKPNGLFSSGIYQVRISGICTQDFSQLSIAFHDGYDEDHTTLKVSFSQNGSLVQKKFSSDDWY